MIPPDQKEAFAWPAKQEQEQFNQDQESPSALLVNCKCAMQVLLLGQLVRHGICHIFGSNEANMEKHGYTCVYRSMLG